MTPPSAWPAAESANDTPHASMNIWPDDGLDYYGRRFLLGFRDKDHHGETGLVPMIFRLSKTHAHRGWDLQRFSKDFNSTGLFHGAAQETSAQTDVST